MLAISHSKTRGAEPPGISQPARNMPYTEPATTTNWETLVIACRFRLPELARVCHVSMRTLQRHFRKHYNTTVSDRVRHLKLERARTMLAQAESVKCVAFD